MKCIAAIHYLHFMNGEGLRKLREAQRLTQEEVAQKAELSQVALSRIETGRTGLSLDDFLRISRALGMRPGDLLENSSGLHADMKPVIDHLRRLPPPVRARTLRIVEEIVGVHEDTILAAQPAPSADNVLPFVPAAPAETAHIMGEDELKAIATAMGGLLEYRKAVRGREFDLPLLGTVSAGKGIEIYEIPETQRSVPEYYYKAGARACFKVAGMSMWDMGITPNDLVFVRPDGTPPDGAIIVCTLNGAAYIKELERKNGRVRLLSHNHAYEPIEVTPDDDLRIYGEVVGRSGNLKER